MVVVDQSKYSAFSTMNPRKYRCSEIMRIAWERDFGTKNLHSRKLVPTS
jgi:hypothetical protein